MKETENVCPGAYQERVVSRGQRVIPSVQSWWWWRKLGPENWLCLATWRSLLPTTRMEEAKARLQWAKEKKGRKEVEAGSMDSHSEFYCKERTR